MTWALKRQMLYIGVIVGFISIFLIALIAPQFDRMPNCADGTRNGSETGVDCGGLCLRACLTEVDKISVLWSRAFRVVDGRYNAVAFLENHNQNTAINSIGYRFRFGDENNVYIGKREGKVFIPPSGRFAIFEPAIDVGSSVPVYTTFEFTEMPDWMQVSKEKIDQLKVLISEISFVDEDTSPKLSATIKNDSLFIIPGVSVVAVLYDEEDNAISASSTYLDVLEGEESREINFTWPEPLQSTVVAREIIPMFNIFSVKLK